MAYEWAKPGAKVVCVDGTPRGGYPDDIWPKVGEVYTLRNIYWCTVNNRVQCRVVEIINTPKKYKYIDELFEAGFRLDRFRPLITKKLPDTLTNLLEKPNRLIVPSGDSYDRRDGGKWDVRKTKEKEKSR